MTHEQAEIVVALRDVEKEVTKALAKFAPFNSGHEGWAVIKEELDELWEHVRGNSPNSPKARMEAIQIAAMAVRYVVDICAADPGDVNP